MRVLVTGSSGFIGSRVSRLLSDGGHRVTGLDVVPPAPDGVATTIGDILEPSALASAMSGVDAVVHLAAVVSVIASEQSPALAHAVNTDGAVAVTRAGLDAGARIVFVSSAAVYGPRTGAVAETDPCAPAGVYGVSKLEAERRLSELAEARPRLLRVVRPFNVYGRGQAYRGADSPLIAAISHALATGDPLTVRGDGSQRRDFIHVDDVARVIVTRLFDDDADAAPLNIGTGAPRSVDEVVRIAEAVAGVTIERRQVDRPAADVAESYADITRLRAAIPGYAPVPLEAGLTDALS